MRKQILSEEEIVEAACYFVLPYHIYADNLEAMFRKIVLAASECGLDLSPEYLAGLSDEHLRKEVLDSYRASGSLSQAKKWFGDRGIINRLKPLSYEDKLHTLFAMHMFHCSQIELETRNRGLAAIRGKA